jgi:hypothetical protein
MADTSTLKYTVDGFDAAHKVLFVTFPDDGRKVNIGLQTFPTTQAELDAVVKPLAAPVETAATAIAAAKTDDPSYVQSVVGKTQVTTRYSSAAAVATAEADTSGSANDLVVGTATKADFKTNIKAADVAYIKTLIAEVLASQATATPAAAPSVTTTTTEATAS